MAIDNIVQYRFCSAKKISATIAWVWKVTIIAWYLSTVYGASAATALLDAGLLIPHSE